MKICVIGAGTYGSYIINSLQEKYSNVDITLFDVGDSSIKSEEEIGYFSSLKQALYKGLTDGRWFGFGGASAKWGGQLLTFTQKDFSRPSTFLQDIVKLNEKYKSVMLKNFDIENNYKEQVVANGLFTKTGVWLSYFGRNFFEYFNINKRKNVNIISQARVTRFESIEGKIITKVFYKQNGVEKEAHFDYYFLSAGAFECARILLNSKILTSNKVKFSDHLSQKVFKIKHGTLIGDEDFAFRRIKTSLITKRLVGEIENYSYYAHPVLNTDLPFFQSFKNLLFKREFHFKAILDVLLNTPETIAFIYSLAIKKRMYVLSGEWFIFIDIENPTQTSYVTLSKQKDKWGEPGLDVYYSIGEKSTEIFTRAKALVKQHLINTKTNFEECFDTINVQTCEDIYHPYGMFCDYNSMEEYYRKYENMLIVSTGILPRAGGINTTAAVLPLIDEFINTYLIYKD